MADLKWRELISIFKDAGAPVPCPLRTCPMLRLSPCVPSRCPVFTNPMLWLSPYDVPRRCPVLTYPMRRLSPSAVPRRCPVLTSAMLLPGCFVSADAWPPAEPL
eukprot:2695298-Rhodomonas_salina.1